MPDDNTPEPIGETIAVMPVPGAPIVDEPVTIVADWHHAPATGAVQAPPVQTVEPYEKDEDGVLVAKVLQPPARPTRVDGPRAEAPALSTPIPSKSAKPRSAPAKTKPSPDLPDAA